eukprot:7304009-Pyramimonas_sp.AAC.1
MRRIRVESSLKPRRIHVGVQENIAIYRYPSRMPSGTPAAHARVLRPRTKDLRTSRPWRRWCVEARIELS